MSGADAQARNLLGGFNGFHASSRLSGRDPVLDVQPINLAFDRLARRPRASALQLAPL